MDKINFISTQNIVKLNKYSPLVSDLNLIIYCSKEYINWVLGFNDKKCKNSTEIKYRTQLKWSLLKSLPYFEIPFHFQNVLNESSIEIIDFAIFCNRIFNSDIPAHDVSMPSYKNYRAKNLTKAIQFFKNKISSNNWGINEEILNTFLELKTQAYLQGLNSKSNKKALIIQHFGIVEPILLDSNRCESYYKSFQNRKYEVNFIINI
ncbi:hypothetical protein U3516DRAFT_344885 [Neocallimastix sp. 'constans']